MKSPETSLLLGNRAYEAAFGSTVSFGERELRLQEIGDEIRGSVSNINIASAAGYARALEMRTLLACLPGFLQAATRTEATTELACRVRDNLRDVLDMFTGTRIYNPNHAANDGGQFHINGKLGEVATLGAMWWAIASKPERSGQYVLPASPEHDISHPNGGGKKTGHDIRRYGSGRALQKIQVKTQGTRGRNGHRVGVPQKKGYAKDIAIVELDRLMSCSSRVAALRLSKALIVDNADELTRVDQDLEAQIVKSLQRN